MTGAYYVAIRYEFRELPPAGDVDAIARGRPANEGAARVGGAVEGKPGHERNFSSSASKCFPAPSAMAMAS